MAQVHTEDGKTRADGASIIPLPGYLKTASREIAVVADDTLHLTPAPQQRVRDLHIEFTVTQGRPELIQTVTGTLSGIAGIAGAFDMEAEQTTGEPASTAVAFTRDGDKLTADARLLGTMEAVQTLVLDIAFTDGGRTQRTEVDLTEALADFNGFQRQHDRRLPCDRHTGNTGRHGGILCRNHRMGKSGRQRSGCGNVV